MNSDGFDQIRLTLNSRNDQRPDISPNGQQIVFVSNRDHGDEPVGRFRDLRDELGRRWKRRLAIDLQRG